MTARPAGRGLRESLSNPKADRIKQVAALAGRSASGGGVGARERSGLFLVEGPQAVRELVRYRAELVRDIYVSDAAQLAHADIVDAALEAELFVHPVTDEVSAAISGDSQGIAAVARMWDVTTVTNPAGSGSSTLIPHGARLVAIFSTARDPGNAGTVIRVADAAGAELVVLAGESVDVFNPKVVRATAGSLFHIPVVRGIAVADAVAAAREAGLTVLAADGGGEVELGAGAGAGAGAGVGEGEGARTGVSSDANGPALDLAAPTAWLFGNEAHGLSAEEIALADHSVRIPIFGKAESLNLAAAAAVALYASALAQR